MIHRTLTQRLQSLFEEALDGMRLIDDAGHCIGAPQSRPLGGELASDGADCEPRLRRLRKSQQVRVDRIRGELARDLHDGLGQTLVALSLEVELLRSQLPDAARRMRALIEEGMGAVRDVSRALRPAKLDLGLLDALRELIAQASSRSATTLVDELADPLPELPDDLTLCLYRIAQEAIGNSLRHAHAGQIVLRVTLEAETLELEVRDDGRGFEPAGLANSNGLGIMGMRERADGAGAEFCLRSAPGRGTCVTVRVALREIEVAR